MITQELLDYIKGQVDAGFDQVTITRNLQLHGWIESDILEAFNTLLPKNTPVASPITEQVATQNPIITNLNTSSTSSVITNTPIKKSHKKLIPVIIGILITILIVGGGAYAYFTGYFIPSREDNVNQALQKTLLVKSGSFDVTITTKIDKYFKSLNKEEGNFFNTDLVNSVKITLKGVFNIKNPTNNQLDGTVSIDASRMPTIFCVRLIDNNFYAQIVKAPTLINLPFLSSLEHQWVAMTPLLESNNEFLSTTQINTMDNENNLIKEKVSAPINSNYISSLAEMIIPELDREILMNLTLEQKEEFYRLVNKTNFITTTNQLGEEIINGKTNNHIAFTFDRAEIVTFITNLEKYIHDIGRNDSRLSSFRASDVIQFFDKLKIVQGELWIGKEDGYINKVIIQTDIVIGEQSVPLGIVGIFNNWNDDVEISKPDSFIKIDTLIQEVFGGNFDITQLGKTTRENEIQALQTQAKLFSQNNNLSFKDFCKSDVVNYDRLQDLSCHDSEKEFVAFIPLLDGKYFCVDTTGFAGSIEIPPKGMFCITNKKTTH